MSLLEYPKVSCPSDKKSDYWYRNGEWICLHCHPPPPGIEELKARARLANRKLYLVWFDLMRTLNELPPEEKGVVLEQYRAGVKRAHEITQQLKDANFTDCLFIENGKKLKSCNIEPKMTEKPGWQGFWCHGCPNEYWYEKELLGEQGD